jgi:C-terminal processing protease CtpA/Prc
VPGSPAEAADLLAHESIVAVNDMPILPEEGIQAVQRIRGEAGTQVILTVQGPAGEVREVAVNRNR